jgi:hypothetical protein
MITRISDVVRSAEDGFVGAVQLIRATTHGLARDVRIEFAARQLAKEHKRALKADARELAERAEDMRSILRRVDELIAKE